MACQAGQAETAAENLLLRNPCTGGTSAEVSTCARVLVTKRDSRSSKILFVRTCGTKSLLTDCHYHFLVRTLYVIDFELYKQVDSVLTS